MTEPDKSYSRMTVVTKAGDLVEIRVDERGTGVLSIRGQTVFPITREMVQALHLICGTLLYGSGG